MSTMSLFMERFGQQVRIRAVDRVASGSPVRLCLTFEKGANTPEAACILARRHLPLRTAHTALTAMVDHGKAFLTLPCVEDIRVLTGELLAVGIVAKVHGPRPLDARTVREGTKLSQEAFAIRYGLDLATLRNWEQRRSTPDAAASTLLWTILRNPEAVEASIDMDADAGVADFGPEVIAETAG